DDNGNPTNLFVATRAQFNFRLGKVYSWTPGHKLGIDIGIPALGLDASFEPQVTVDFGMHLGFGVDLHKGFYLDTKNGSMGPEISLKVSARLSAVTCPGGAPASAADANGQLLFLAIHLVDGVDLNGNGQVNASCLNGSLAGVAPQTEELSVVYFSGSVD